MVAAYNSMFTLVLFCVFFFFFLCIAYVSFSSGALQERRGADSTVHSETSALVLGRRRVETRARSAEREP